MLEIIFTGLTKIMQKTNRTDSPESFASLFEKPSGLATWKAWFAALLVVFFFFTIAWFIPSFGENLVTVGLYILLFTVGVGCIGKSYSDVKFIDRGTRLASEQVRILEEVDDSKTFLDCAQVSVFRSHIENLYTISSAPLPVDP
ncbi:hypothetical protein SAMN05216404_11321 [Nitrosospira multiformis]|uniref:Uncharacterized protein n=1 Tax=Nitrosospira multiformis TaxID=1231 RepID=A0A1H8MLM3_9PROT|nr:hypothetical protein SAMN05216404_11321 [Nitrosospira multiformis]